jgi:hypothetical protein
MGSQSERPILFAPHADDETLFAAFTCIREHPTIITCFKPAEPERETEADIAAGLLGCKRHQWPLLGNESNETIEGFFWGLLDPVSDEVPPIYAPAIEREGLEEHNVIGVLADRVFERQNVTHYMTYSGHPRRKSRGIEVEFEPAWVWTKLRCLAAYQSQAATASWFHFAEDLREYRA